MKRMPSYLLIALISAYSAMFAADRDCRPACPSSQTCSDCPSKTQETCTTDASCSNCTVCSDRSCPNCCQTKPGWQNNCSDNTCPAMMLSSDPSKCETCPCPMRNDSWCATNCDDYCDQQVRDTCDRLTRSQKICRADDSIVARLLKLPLRLTPYGLGILYYLYLFKHDWNCPVLNLSDAEKVRFNKAINQFVWVGIGVWLWDRIKADAKDLETLFLNTLSSITA